MRLHHLFLRAFISLTEMRKKESDEGGEVIHVSRG